MDTEIFVCKICGRNSKEANLLTAILDREREFVKICETCAVVEHAVIIPKPTKKQLVETEVPYTVYERLARMSGVKPKENVLMQERMKQEKAQQAARNFIGKQETKFRNQAGQPTDRQSIKVLEEKGRKEAVIDFSSNEIKIGDLQKLKKEMLEK